MVFLIQKSERYAYCSKGRPATESGLKERRLNAYLFPVSLATCRADLQSCAAFITKRGLSPRISASELRSTECFGKPCDSIESITLSIFNNSLALMSFAVW